MQSGAIHQIKHLFKKEVLSEWKNRYALLSIVLLLVVSVFVVYTIDKVAPDRSWHSYFYLILLFGVVQNIGRSFLGESKGVHLYYRVTVKPESVLISKMLYQVCLNLIFVALLFGIMNFFLPQQIPALGAYLITAGLFTMCNVTIFTFNASIALGAKNSALTASVLSFPLLLPALMISLRAASKALLNSDMSLIYRDWAMLFLLWSITVILAVVLFKFVWTD